MDRLKKIKIKRMDAPPKYKGLKIAFLFFCILAVWIFAMNLLSNKVHPIRETATHLTQGGLYYELALDKSLYKIGEPIQLKLIIKNLSDKEQVLTFATTQRSLFSVRRDIDFVFFHVPIDIWKSSYGKIYESKPEDLVIKPGEEKTFEETWNQSDVNGQQVPPGRFLISASVASVGATTMLELPTRMKK